MSSAALQRMLEVMTQDPQEKPFSIGGCHALEASSPQVARFLPRWYKPESTPAATPDKNTA
jgi:hypothetical protein